MGKEQGAAAYEERDLLEEASRGCSVPCAEGNPARDNWGTASTGHVGCSQGQGREGGPQLFCSECAPSLDGTEPQQPLSLQQAVDAPPSTHPS